MQKAVTRQLHLQSCMVLVDAVSAESDREAGFQRGEREREKFFHRKVKL